MAYFSNGTEGAMYQERYCARCIHDIDEDCPVWALHLLYNGEAEWREMLDALIPMNDDGGCAKCRMFVLRDEQTSILPEPVIEEHVREIDGVFRVVF